MFDRSQEGTCGPLGLPRCHSSPNPILPFLPLNPTHTILPENTNHSSNHLANQYRNNFSVFVHIYFNIKLRAISIQTNIFPLFLHSIPIRRAPMMSSPALVPVVVQPPWLPPATPPPALSRFQPSFCEKKEEKFKKVENPRQQLPSIFSVVHIINYSNPHTIPITLKNKTPLLVLTTVKSQVFSLVGRLTYTGRGFLNIMITSVMEWLVFQLPWWLVLLGPAARHHDRSAAAGCAQRWSSNLSREND